MNETFTVEELEKTIDPRFVTLLEIWDTMDVPQTRKEKSLGGLGWMIRNMAIRNFNHPRLEEAMKLAHELHKELLDAIPLGRN